MPPKSDKPGLLQGFEETKAYSWRRQSWRRPHHSGKREPSRGSSGGGSCSSPSNSGSSVGSASSVGPSGKTFCENASSSGRPNSRRHRKPIICHGCGEPGHIRPQCPNHVWNVGCVRSVRVVNFEVPMQSDNSAKVEVSMQIEPEVACEAPAVALEEIFCFSDSLFEPEVACDAPAVALEEIFCFSDTLFESEVAYDAPAVALEEIFCFSDTLFESEVACDAPAVAMDDIFCSSVSPFEPESESPIEVYGWLAGVLVKDLQIDTGACRTVVSSKYIPRSAYLGKSITLDSWRGRQYSEHKLAKITIKVGGVSTDAVVVVAEQLDCPALLGTDLGAAMTVQLTGIVHDKAKVALSKVNDEVPMHVEQVSVTRAQDRENDLASAQSECEPVALADVLDLPESYFEPEEAGDASVVALEDIFWPDLGEVEFPLPDLDDDVLEASVAPACSDTFVVPRQLTEVKDEVLEVLEASVAPVCCTNIVVPRHLEEVKDEVLEAGVASVDSDKIVVPMQQVVVKVDLAVDWVAPADAVSDVASDTVCDNFNLPEEFFVEDQADVVAFGPVDCTPMVGLDVSDFVDSLSETDPVLAPVPVARPEPEKVVIVVILAMEDSIPPKLCWQSPTVLVDHCLRCTCCVTKATGKFAPGSCAVILAFDMFILVISAICSFCSCISMCLSKFLVVLFFGAFGPRAVPLLHGLDKPPWRMLGAPSVPWILDWLGGSLLPYEGLPVASSPATFGQPEGGGDVMESPSQYQQLPNIQLTCQLEHDLTYNCDNYVSLLFYLSGLSPLYLLFLLSHPASTISRCVDGSVTISQLLSHAIGAG